MARNSALRFFSLLIIGALVSAYVAEYYFGIAPCHYCFYQRYLFMAAAACFLIKPIHKLGFLALLAGLALSLYQIGLEQHLWTDILHKCKAPLPQFTSDTQLHDFLKEAPIVRCDQVNWRIFGISAVIWIALFQAGLVILYSLIMGRYRYDK